ncbi:MAG TPA: SAF domain-containing protein, partial [Candidatus Limnocylindrales bacterium]|nr:SAF domain-containing protein [Candidatus Limnocylindrales bacterium]
MKRSNRLILLIGIFLAVVAFVLIVLLLSGQEGPSTSGPTEPPPQDTVIATQDIAIGVTITEAMVTTETLPRSAREPGAFEAPSQVIGKVDRQEVTSGGQITSTTFSSNIDLGISVPEGQRAMSLQIDAV